MLAMSREDNKKDNKLINFRNRFGWYYSFHKQTGVPGKEIAFIGYGYLNISYWDEKVQTIGGIWRGQFGTAPS